MIKKSLIAAALAAMSITAIAGDCRDLVPGGQFPQYPGQVIICKTHFVVGYSPELKSLIWASEKLSPDQKLSSVPRPSFKVDPTVDASVQAKPSDYEGSPYDRGHMVPYEDMTFDPTALQEVMYMTNIVPQISAFNRGMWKALETATRKYGSQNAIYVVTGATFQPPISYLEKNPSIPVPTNLFKVIFKEGQAPIAYLIPNIVPVNKFSYYGTTIDKVEAASGIRFTYN